MIAMESVLSANEPAHRGNGRCDPRGFALGWLISEQSELTKEGDYEEIGLE
jgi:hypothetical protein